MIDSRMLWVVQTIDSHFMVVFSGYTCEQEVNECMMRPCLNNGLCVDQLNDFQCSCRPGYSGKRCELNINSCTEACKLYTVVYVVVALVSGSGIKLSLALLKDEVAICFIEGEELFLGGT